MTEELMRRDSPASGGPSSLKITKRSGTSAVMKMIIAKTLVTFG
jgi:hypothetical protein